MTQNLLKTLYLGKTLTEDELQDIPNYRGKNLSTVDKYIVMFKLKIDDECSPI